VVIIIKMDMNTEMGQSRVSPLRDRVNYSETHSSYDNMSSEATITDQIEQFEEERLAEIREKVKVIVFPGLLLLCSGAMGLVVTAVTNTAITPIDGALWNLCVSVSSLLFMIGFLIVSSAQEFDIDEFIIQYWPSLHWICLCIGILFAFVLALLPPYFAVFLLLHMIYCTYDYITQPFEKRLDFTFMLSFFALLQFSLIWPWPIFIAIMYDLGYAENSYSIVHSGLLSTDDDESDTVVEVCNLFLVYFPYYV
jgi:hypothetical protein